MPRGIKRYMPGDATRTAKCTICGMLFRGDHQETARRIKCHNRVRHPSRTINVLDVSDAASEIKHAVGNDLSISDIDKLITLFSS